MIHFIRTKNFSEKLPFLGHMTGLEMLLFRKIFRAYQKRPAISVKKLIHRYFSKILFKSFCRVKYAVHFHKLKPFGISDQVFDFFRHFSRIGDFEWFWVGSLCKNIR